MALINNPEQSTLMTKHLARLQEIGVALSAEHRLDRLLNLILKESRILTSADAGSIFIREDLKVQNQGATAKDSIYDITKQICLKVVQNDSMDYPFKEMKIPLDKSSIAGYVAHKGKILHIPDVYNIPKEAPYTYSTDYDRASGYTCKSMLVVPMKDKSGEVIGVMQLINKKNSLQKPESTDDINKHVVSFNSMDEKLILPLSSQAGVCIEKAKLYEEMEGLFDSFVRSLTIALEKRNKTTYGHCIRVSEYATAIAVAISDSSEPPFHDIHYTEDQLKELRYAALLHDIGKLSVPEAVLDKRNKLTDPELACVIYRLSYVKNSSDDKELASKIDRYISHIKKINVPRPMSDGDAKLLDEIKATTFTDVDGETKPLLNNYEYENLSIRYGNLTKDERKQIEQHIVDTWEILKRIPWPHNISMVPNIAACHHEKLNGSGYPWRFRAPEIPLGGKILALVDIYEALTAKDRPYKPPIPTDKALKIVEDEVNRGNLDEEIYRIFVEKKIYNLFSDTKTGHIKADNPYS